MSTHALSSSTPGRPGIAGTGASQQNSDRPLRTELPRSISTTNLETTSRCRSVIQKDWKASAPRGGTNYFATTPAFTLILPALNDYPSDFQKFVFDRIVAKNTQEMMEREFCLNWCPNVTKLVPLSTIGDGNCLLHAASLAMWGFQDRDLVLREAVSHAVNVNVENNTLYQRWKHNRMIENREHGIELEPHQWVQEWEEVKQQSSALSGQHLDSLDEFHVFVLANILRRPIIMYAAPKLRSHQTNGTLQKINFHGVYLPLLWAPDSCKKDPLPLAYNLGHFSALVVVESFEQYRHGLLLLALSDYYSQQLPVRFILPIEDPNTLMMDYLRLVQVPGSGSPYLSSRNVVCAKLTISDVPSYLKPLISGFVDVCYESYIARLKSSQSSDDQTNADRIRPHCINNCGMYGDPATGLCSKCHQKAISAAHAQEKAAFEDETSQQAQGQFQRHTQDYVKTSDAVGDQHSTMSVSGAIKCPRCSNLGHPSYLGMCKHCFVSSSANQDISVVNTIKQELSVSETMKVGDPVYEVLPNEHKLSAKGQQPRQLTISQPPALPLPRNAGDKLIERSQCRTPGCEFFGTKETRFYCSKCFDTNVEMILNEVDRTIGNALPVQSQPQHPSSGDEVAHHTEPFREPLKCYKCKDFFASEEYSGLCNSCFMTKTRTESNDVVCGDQLKVRKEPSMKPTHQEKSPQVTCSEEYCTNPATDNGFCEYCNAIAVGRKACQFPTSEVSSQQSEPQCQPPSSAEKLHLNTNSGTVVSLGTSMAKVSLTTIQPSWCFLCDEGNSIGSSNFVCEHHARMMQQMICSKPVESIARVRGLSPSPYEEPRLIRCSEEKLSVSYSGVHSSDNNIDVAFGIPLTPNLSEHHPVPVMPAACSKFHANVPGGGFTRHPGFIPVTNSQRNMNDSRTQNTTGMIVSGQTSGEENPPVKTLCATPGCSFKGYEQLQKLCPDCFQEIYNTVPSQQYPLV